MHELAKTNDLRQDAETLIRDRICGDVETSVAFLNACQALRGHGANLVLRPNLTGNFSGSDLRQITAAFDQVAISVDGDEPARNTRRNAETYANVTEN